VQAQAHEDIRFTQGRGNYVDDLKLQACYSAISFAHRTRTPVSKASTHRKPGAAGVKRVDRRDSSRSTSLYATLAGDVAAC